MLLRPGNAGSNTEADHVMVIDRSLAQIPEEQLEKMEILMRADSDGATHGTPITAIGATCGSRSATN